MKTSIGKKVEVEWLLGEVTTEKIIDEDENLFYFKPKKNGYRIAAIAKQFCKLKCLFKK